MNIQEKLNSIVNEFDRENFRIISHHDADGIASAGILCNSLLRKQKKFHVSLIRSLNSEFINKIKNEENEFIVFLDMGSGQIENIETIDSKIVILDHHVPIRKSDKAIQVNTHFFGINGSFEACASTVAFLLALELDEKNWESAYLFLAGVIGDRQHVNGLKGLNKELVEIGIKKGYIKYEKDIDLSGKNISIGLENSGDPFFDGISGNNEKASLLLSKLEINKEQKIIELTKEQKTKLTSFLLLKLLKQGANYDSAQQLIIDKYIANGINTYDFSNWINACGRMGNLSLGLAVCLGDKNALKKARIIRENYRKELIKGLAKLKKSTKIMENIQYFYVDSAFFGGAYAGIGMQYLLGQNKPTIALFKKENTIKISSRGTKYLLSKGLDLASALRSAAEKCGGDGGGHKIASGATIPIENERKFLENLNDIVGKQLLDFGNKRAANNV